MASTIKVDNVQNQPGTNIVSKCGTDVTLGASGDTIALACGASQTGFGRTGTVDWDTSIKTGTVTAASGSGYFVNSTAGEITVNLPAASVGDIVAVSDYASTANTNNILVAPNGSENINAVNENYTISTNGLAVTLVYADATRGWKSVTGSDADATGVATAYIAATGGNQPVSTGCIVCTDYKVHKFTGPGTFCVSAGSGPISIADYMVVAGGGGGGAKYGGGGGAGGFRESPGTASGCYSVSPLGAAPAVALDITVQGYPITVGGGGAGGTGTSGPSMLGANGSTSTFSTIDSAGGGGSTGDNSSGTPTGAADGGSGGGSSYTPCTAQPFGGGGAGNTPPTNPAQGTPGGDGGGDAAEYTGGGGGGATVAGTAGSNPAKQAGPGGTGATTSISATPTAYAGGGGAGGNSQGPGCVAVGTGGTGGGGAGAGPPSVTGVAGGINTGGGAGAGGFPAGAGGLGGSGIVIIRYKFQ